MTGHRLAAPIALMALMALIIPVRARAQAATSSTIAGRVVEPAGNQPVRRAIVTATGGALGNGRSAVTDDNGQFAIGGLPEGDYTLTVTRPGFLTSRYGASRPGRPGTPIAVRAGATFSGLSIPMTRGSALGGRIRDTVGDAAPGMRVEAIRILHASTGDRAETLGETITDDRGQYRIFGLPAGDYILATTQRTMVGGLGAISAPTEAEVDARINALKSRSNAPTPAAPSTAPAPPLDKGYAMPPIYYPGVVTPGEAVTVTLGAAESREGLDIGVRLSHAADVDGIVVASRGVALPMVLLGLETGGPQLPAAGGSAAGPSVRMDNNTHTFHISNVPVGHYRLNAHTFGAPGASTQIMSSGGALPKIDASAAVLWGTIEFDVAGENVAGLTLTVQPAPSVTGHIAADAAALKAPARLAGARISLLPMPDSDRRSNGLSAPIAAVASADGAFNLPAVIPGAYRVTAALASGWWLRSAITAGADVLDGVLDVGPDGVSDLTLTMSDRHSGVGGTLTTTGGPATEYFLVAFSADKSMWRAPSRRVRSTRPATTGAFELMDLPPGQYYLAVLRDLDAADLEDPAFLESLIPASAAVAVLEGQRTAQDLRIGG